MRFHLVTAPDVADGRLAHPLGLGHQPTTPVGHACRLGLQGRLHQGFDLLRPIGGLAPAPRSDLPQALQAVLRKTGAPQSHGLAIGSQLAGDGAFRVTLNRRQDNAAAQRHLLGCSVGTQPLPNLLLLAGIHHQYRKFSRHAQA